VFTAIRWFGWEARLDVGCDYRHGVMTGESVPAAAAVADLRRLGLRTVLLTGDSPAVADLGLALGSGTDVAITAADLILLRDDLAVIPDAIRLARATLATIRRNLAWAFGYNIAAIPLAAAGFLNPLIAGAAMAASSAFVVASSVRLRRFGVTRPPGRDRLPAGRLPGGDKANSVRQDEELSCLG
jgi:P-type Cu+ transporter